MSFPWACWTLSLLLCSCICASLSCSSWTCRDTRALLPSDLWMSLSQSHRSSRKALLPSRVVPTHTQKKYYYYNQTSASNKLYKFFSLPLNKSRRSSEWPTAQGGRCSRRGTCHTATLSHNKGTSANGGSAYSACKCPIFSHKQKM